MKRTGFKRKAYKPMKRTRLKVVGDNDTATLKKEIQRLVREIVIKRDGGCVLRKIRKCNDPVLQADHLITRANSSTYADTRLIVCLCRSCHGGYKQWHEKEYDLLVKSILPKERVALWERCQLERLTPHRTGSYDWKLQILALKKELKSYD